MNMHTTTRNQHHIGNLLCALKVAYAATNVADQALVDVRIAGGDCTELQARMDKADAEVSRLQRLLRQYKPQNALEALIKLCCGMCQAYPDDMNPDHSDGELADIAWRELWRIAGAEDLALCTEARAILADLYGTAPSLKSQRKAA